MPPVFVRGQKVSQRWQVQRKLGEGQFAEVYEVKDLQDRDRDKDAAVSAGRNNAGCGSKE